MKTNEQRSRRGFTPRLIASLLILPVVTLCWPRFSAATKPTIVCPDPAEPASCFTAVKKWQRAPFAGDLYTPKASAGLVARARAVDEQIEQAVTATVSHWKVLLEDQRTVGRIDADAAYERGRLDGGPAWYESAWFWGPLGVAGGIALAFAGVELAKER